MYAKMFSSILSSSIWTEDNPTRILFITLLALCDREGYVYGSPSGLADIARLPREICAASLERLMAPDPESSDLERNPDNEGRRLEKIFTGGWRIINYPYYRDLHDADTRRAQYRESKRRKRAEKRLGDPVTASRDGVTSTAVRTGPQESTDVHLLTHTHLNSESVKKERDIGHKRFEPPPTDAVRDFFAARGSSDHMSFLAFYDSNGWKVGKNPMKNWQAAAAGWIMRNGQGRASNNVR